MQYSVVKEFAFDAGHRVLGHGGKCRFLHGHRYRALVEVSVETLNELKMVIDFYDLKAIIMPLVMEWDHGMELAQGDPLGPTLVQLGQRVSLVPGNATVEVMAQVLYDRCVVALGPPYQVESVRLWETPTCCAVVRRTASDASW